MNKKKVDSILKGITAAGIAMGGVSSIQGADMVMAAIKESAADANSLVDAGSLSESERTEYSESTTQSMSESASESTSESVSVSESSSESSSASESAKQSDAEQQSGDNVVAAAYTDDAEQDMLVTTNEYLASRDGADMGEVYNFMGLTCSYPDADDTKKQDDDEKRQFYSADIIYTTNGALGFDFLFDNLVKKKEDRFLCDFHYVIIDEADSVLLDSAIMPLVISGVPRVQSNLYDVCDFFVTTLVEDIDYREEDKAVWLTPKGVKFAESFFGISNFYGKENFEINRHVTLSLRAHKLLKNKKDYVVTDKKEVELFDGATGRLMHGVKLRGGQHQAIEAKEKVEISQE